jgi:guanylate kinase
MAGVLIERAAFLASLEELLGEALDGSGRLVFLGGEAGVGKTTLAAALPTPPTWRSGGAPATTSRPPRRSARSWTPCPS